MLFEKQLIQTKRRKIAFIREGDPDKQKIVLVHGNTSGSAFFIPLIEELKKNYDVIAMDLNGFGKTESSPVNAPTGLYDWSEDVDSLLEELNINKFSLLGWSLGGGVVMKYCTLHPEKITKLILVSPMSPYGFGGTYDLDGKLINENGLGCPGGFVNKLFYDNLLSKNRSKEPNTAYDAMYKLIFNENFRLPEDLEKIFIDEMLEMRLGVDYYAGDYSLTADFPYVLPGTKGISNSLAPQYANVSDIVDIDIKPEILWFRGDKDKIVSDTSISDLAYLGKLGLIPNYPGEDKFPPQPMISQTRYVLDKYAQNGGKYKEYIIKDTAHGCLIENVNEFTKLLNNHLL